MAVKETQHVDPQVDTVVDLRVGEYLLYKITALGSTPMFTLADDRGRTILTSEGVSPQMKVTVTAELFQPFAFTAGFCV